MHARLGSTWFGLCQQDILHALSDLGVGWGVSQRRRLDQIIRRWWWWWRRRCLPRQQLQQQGHLISDRLTSVAAKIDFELTTLVFSIDDILQAGYISSLVYRSRNNTANKQTPVSSFHVVISNIYRYLRSRHSTWNCPEIWSAAIRQNIRRLGIMISYCIKFVLTWYRLSFYPI